MDLITSTSNEKMKYIKKLSRKSFRQEERRFIVEGTRAVQDAVTAGADFVTIVYGEHYIDKLPQIEGEYICVSDKVFSVISQTEAPQKILGVANMPTWDFDAMLQNNCVVYCDGVQDPGNIGSIIRTADAAGCGGVLLSKGCVDVYNPKTVRSTMSALFNLPVIQESEPYLSRLKGAGFQIIASALTEQSVNFFDCDLQGKIVLVVGNEGNGISQAVMEYSDTCVKIPMLGKIESLNVAAAAAVMLYERVRQVQRNRNL